MVMQPPPEENFNPYASPKSEALLDGQDADDLGTLAAGEVIEIEGVLSPKDLFHACRLAQRGEPRDSFVGCAIIVVFVALPWAIVFSGVKMIPFAAAWVCLLGLAVIARVGYAAVRQARLIYRYWHAQRGIFRPQRIEITDSGVRQQTEAGLAAYRWTAFSKCASSERVLVLHFDPPATLVYDPPAAAMVIPRAFFTSDGQWEHVVRVVRKKLPEKYQEKKKGEKR